MNNLEKIFYEENGGIAERFRNGQYYLDDNEISLIKDFVKDIEKQAKEFGKINSKDVSFLIEIIEILYMTDSDYDGATPIIELLNNILFNVEKLKIM